MSIHPQLPSDPAALDAGATTAEYGILITVIAAVVALIAAVLGTQVATLYTAATSNF